MPQAARIAEPGVFQSPPVQQPDVVHEQEVVLRDGVFTKVEHTSLATRYTAPDEITVQFRKWTTWGGTAYQKGQHAGFQGAVANRLIAVGVAFYVEGPRERALAHSMVTK